MSIKQSLEYTIKSYGGIEKSVNIGVAIKLYDLEDENKTKNYTMEDWNEILKLSKKDEEFIAALFKAKNVPHEIYEKLFDNHMISEEQIYGAIKCNDIPIDLIGKLKESQPTKFWAEYLSDKDNLLEISDVLITCLCESTFPELEEMNYKPFELVKDEYITGLINDTICKPNFSMFPGEVPEGFTSSATNNIYLTDETRNKAFDMGFVPYQMTNFTKYTAEEYYKFFADNLFEIFPTTKLEKRHNQISSNYIMHMMITGKLSEACQEDFIQRFQNSITEVDDRAYKAILQHTKSSNVLHSACCYKMKTYKHLIAENPNLSEFVKKELFPYFTEKEQKVILLRMLCNNKLTENGLNEMMSCGDINLNRAMIINPNIPEKIRENLINDGLYSFDFDELFSSQFKMLNEVSKALNVIDCPKTRDRIMYNILKSVMNQDKIRNYKDILGKECVSHEKTFKTIELNTKNKLKKLSDEHFVAISEELKKLQKRFPSQKDILEICIEDLREINKHSKLHCQFSEFYIHDKETNLIEFNFDKFYHISKDNLNKLIDYVKNEEDIRILEKLQSDIKFGISTLPLCDCDIVYKSIAKFTMLYSVINDKIEELEKEPMSEEIDR